MGDGFDGLLYRAVGCAHCNHTGYAGRLGVYEAITIDDEMRRLIGDNASEDALAEAAFARADRLAASARSAVAAGLTTLEEALRVTRQDDGPDDGAQPRAEGLGDVGVCLPRARRARPEPPRRPRPRRPGT